MIPPRSPSSSTTWGKGFDDEVVEAMAQEILDGAAVRAFLAAVAERAACGVLIVAHDTKGARNETRAGEAPGAGAVKRFGAMERRGAGRASPFGLRGAAPVARLREKQLRPLRFPRRDRAPSVFRSPGHR